MPQNRARRRLKTMANFAKPAGGPTKTNATSFLTSIRKEISRPRINFVQSREVTWGQFTRRFKMPLYMLKALIKISGSINTKRKSLKKKLL